jgi:hypothetical protein
VGALEAGQYARTSDGFTAYIYGRDHEENHVAICRHNEERTALANELTPWSPQNGERVVEAGNEGGLGIVVEAGDEESLVVWKGFLRQVSWLNTNLEPVWSD